MPVFLPLDLYNHYKSTTHTCVEQFSHHHACVPVPPVFTSLAETMYITFLFSRSRAQYLYLHLSRYCRCSLFTASKKFMTATQFIITVYNIQRELDLVLEHTHRHSNSGPPFSSFGPSCDYGMNLSLEVYL